MGVRGKGETWGPREDQMVLLCLAGRTQREVAELYDVSRGTVQRIVSDERAVEIRELARARYKERLIESLEDELDLSAKLAVKAVRKTLEADISPTHKAKANQDRVATKILAGRGFLTKDRGEGGGMQMTDEQFKKLTEALDKSDQARGIDPFDGKIIEAEVEEEEEAGVGP